MRLHSPVTSFFDRSIFVVVVGMLANIGWPAPARSADELLIDVREIAGLERVGCPAAYQLELPAAVPKATTFALQDDKGNPVIAQFSPASDGPLTNRWWLDFSAPLKPWQTRRYSVHYGAGVQAAGEGTGGNRLLETEASFQVTNAPYITWTVPKDLAGLLHSVDFPPNDHVRPDSQGLVLRDRDGREHVLGKGFHSGRATRNGRRAVALQFTGTARDEVPAGVRSTVDLTFPSPVSWVEVDWTIEDPQDRVSGLGMTLRLALDPPRGDAPTLVDFGAGTWVYAALNAGQAAELQGGPATGRARPDRLWRVLRGPADRMIPFAVAPDQADARAEGWGHIMDRRSCLALAVDQFGSEAADRIVVTAEGDVTIWRNYEQKHAESDAAAKRLRFWLHFVFYPPQHSAATSPRMMQTPPEISTVGSSSK